MILVVVGVMKRTMRVMKWSRKPSRNPRRSANRRLRSLLVTLVPIQSVSERLGPRAKEARAREEEGPRGRTLESSRERAFLG